jgi:L-alanine-DL-glutamate epimerase-like enolase superfamily enzyme
MLGGLSEARRAAMLAGRRRRGSHTPFVGPASLASLCMLAVTEAKATATVEADDLMASTDRPRAGRRARRADRSGAGFDPDPGFLHRYDYAKE